jgi:broad specificity polyphosphatase/5'/3'-nucleotidase SurE
MKEALRRGLRAEPLQATVAAPAADRSARSCQDTLTTSLAEIRQVVEVAVASALDRYQGELSSPAAATTTEEHDEMEDLLEAFKDSLVLGGD